MASADSKDRESIDHGTLPYQLVRGSDGTGT